MYLELQRRVTAAATAATSAFTEIKAAEAVRCSGHGVWMSNARFRIDWKEGFQCSSKTRVDGELQVCRHVSENLEFSIPCSLAGSTYDKVERNASWPKPTSFCAPIPARGVSSSCVAQAGLFEQPGGIEANTGWTLNQSSEILVHVLVLGEERVKFGASQSDEVHPELAEKVPGTPGFGKFPIFLRIRK